MDGQTTAVGFACLGTVDTIREMLEYEGYTVHTTKLSEDHYQIVVEGELDDMEHAEVHGMVRGAFRVLTQLVEAGCL